VAIWDNTASIPPLLKSFVARIPLRGRRNYSAGVSMRQIRTEE
jgi:hypothetical protein